MQITIVERFSENSIEQVESCPWCGGRNRTNELVAVDKLFRSSNRPWPYARCTDCDSLYLSERPREEYIGNAYLDYYTHESNRASFSKWLVEKYISSGYKRSIAAMLINAVPPLRSFLRAKARGLAQCHPGKVLDFGCGDGDFLSRLDGSQWIRVGIDFDEGACINARKKGLDVWAGGVERLKALPSEEFDAVTLSHVLEHLYDPNEVLAECYRVLKPGGHLWVETPNSRAGGLLRFRSIWRGLEPPRHIFVVGRPALLSGLRRAGFVNSVDVGHFFSSLYMYVHSERISERKGSKKIGYLVAIVLGLLADVKSVFSNRSSEFCSVKCQRRFS